jgi:hypothetical protein
VSRVHLLSRRDDDDLELKIITPKNESVSLFVNLRELKGKNAHEKAISLADDLGCALCCSRKTGYAACLARCLADGRCCNSGIDGCEDP